MPIKKIPLKDAPIDALRKYATEVLGFADIAPTMNAVALRAKIQAARPGQEIILDVQEPDPNEPERYPTPEPAKLDPAGGREQKVQVTIAADEGPGGDEHVPLNPNGRAMWVPRGVPVWIPEAHFEVLKNAVRTKYRQLEDGSMEGREVPLFSYTVHRIA